MIATADQLKRWAVVAGIARPSDEVAYKAVVADSMRVTRDERDGENGDVFIVRAVANTAAVDLDDEVVLPEGADTSYFFGTRAIYLNHNTADAVGRLISASKVKEPRGWRWMIQFSVTGATSLGRDTRSLIRERIINGVSIGFIARKYGRPTPDETRAFGVHRNIVRDWLWLETSLTPMPCNPDALISARSKGLISPHTATVLELPDAAPSRKVLVLS